MANYVARIADHELDARLRVMGAVLIEGPKACGKTATASQIANTIIRLDEDPVARAQLDFDPQALFSGRPPILFDEWQVEPEIWNRVRRQVDDREEKGQFILTGSARPRDNANRHSGAGRFSVMQMRPMSLFETGHSTGEISLANLLAGERQAGLGTHLSFDNLIQRPDGTWLSIDPKYVCGPAENEAHTVVRSVPWCRLDGADPLTSSRILIAAFCAAGGLDAGRPRHPQDP